LSKSSPRALSPMRSARGSAFRISAAIRRW
jgi:hypothetical protein